MINYKEINSQLQGQIFHKGLKTWKVELIGSVQLELTIFKMKSHHSFIIIKENWKTKIWASNRLSIFQETVIGDT
jgi:capsule polysaccharide export protein KpsC/LpsZ